METSTIIVVAIGCFLLGAVFGVCVKALMNIASSADRDNETHASKDEPDVTEEVIAEIRLCPRFAKNYEVFMQKYHPDVMEDPYTKWTSDIFDEYIAWCNSPEGRPYFEE